MYSITRVDLTKKKQNTLITVIYLFIAPNKIEAPLSRNRLPFILFQNLKSFLKTTSDALC